MIEKERLRSVIKESEILEYLDRYKTDSSLLFCVYTTYFKCTAYSHIEDISHALEIRLFDENGEFKAVRTNIGRDFKCRYIADSDYSDEDKYLIYDEVQYLDSDSTKTNGTKYVSLGGGEYEMPYEGLERVVIRHYGEYDDDGMLQLKDLRIVGFLKEGE